MLGSEGLWLHSERCCSVLRWSAEPVFWLTLLVFEFVRLCVHFKQGTLCVVLSVLACTIDYPAYVAL